MDELVIRYVASPTLARFHLSSAPVRLMVGPVGSGKSSAATTELWRRAHETPPGKDGVRRSRACVIRNTYPELRDTTINTFKQWIKPFFGKWKGSEHTFLLQVNDVECEVLFRSLDTPDDVKKLLSLELTFAWINEAKEIPRPVFDMIQTRLGRYPPKLDVPYCWSGLWADSNPPDTDHYLYRIFEEERPEGFEVFKQPGGLSDRAENLAHLDRCPGCSCPQWQQGVHLADCLPEFDALGRPKKHLDPCQCYYVAKFRGKSKDWIKVYRDGEYGFVMEGKPVYPEFQDSVHVAEFPLLPKLDVMLIGNDFGLTPAAVFGQVDPRDGQYQIIDEIVSEHLGAVNFGRLQEEKVAEWRRAQVELRGAGRTFRTRGWGDPAGTAESQVDERTPFSVLSPSLNIAPAPTNDPMRRREAVAKKLTTLTMLGRPALVIHPRCKTLRKAMAGGYCYRRLEVAGAERFVDHPNKNNPYSHVAEALQYLVVGEGQDQAILPAEEEPYRINMEVRMSNGEVKVPGQDHSSRFGVKRSLRRW